jgi:ABC-type cobalamin transport system permease subunit
MSVRRRDRSSPIMPRILTAIILAAALAVAIAVRNALGDNLMACVFGLLTIATIAPLASRLTTTQRRTS